MPHDVPTGRPRPAAWLALMIVALAALVACGGDDDDGGPAPGGADRTPDSGGGGATATPAGNGGGATATSTGDGGGGSTGGFDFGKGTATVAIGDREYEFDLKAGSAVCRNVFDAMQVAGRAADNADIKIDAWIPPTNWETFTDGRYDPPGITITDDTVNARWVADASRVEILPDFPPESMVNSYEKEGLAAQGRATFVNEYALLRGESAAPVEGTFEIACDD